MPRLVASGDELATTLARETTAANAEDGETLGTTGPYNTPW